MLDTITRFYDEGNDLKLFIDQFLNFCMDVTKYAIFNSCDMIRIPSSMEELLKNTVNLDNPASRCMYIVDKLLGLKNMLKNDNSPRSTIEIVFLQMCRWI